jgi:transcription elongation factor Elf1
MSTAKYPFAPKVVAAVNKLKRLGRPMGVCNRCNTRQAIYKSELHRAAGLRCASCGGRVELEVQEVRRRKRMASTLDTHTLKRKPAKSSWTAPLVLAKEEETKKEGYIPLPHALPGSTLTEPVRQRNEME